MREFVNLIAIGSQFSSLHSQFSTHFDLFFTDIFTTFTDKSGKLA